MTQVTALDTATQAAPLLRQLRGHLDDDTFTARLDRAEAQGYRVLAATDGDQMVGALGYRITDDLNWGRTLYVDDLMVDHTRWREGIGRALLDHARGVAREAGCDHIRLCSALNRHDVHKFYMISGMKASSMQFTERLES